MLHVFGRSGHLWQESVNTSQCRRNVQTCRSPKRPISSPNIFPNDYLNDESSKKQKTELSFGYNLALLGKHAFLISDYMNASLSWLVSEEIWCRCEPSADWVGKQSGDRSFVSSVNISNVLFSTNLVPGVLKLLGQRVVPGRESGVVKKYDF